MEIMVLSADNSQLSRVLFFVLGVHQGGFVCFARCQVESSILISANVGSFDFVFSPPPLKIMWHVM